MAISILAAGGASLFSGIISGYVIDRGIQAYANYFLESKVFGTAKKILDSGIKLGFGQSTAPTYVTHEGLKTDPTQIEDLNIETLPEKLPTHSLLLRDLKCVYTTYRDISKAKFFGGRLDIAHIALISAIAISLLITSLLTPLGASFAFKTVIAIFSIPCVFVSEAMFSPLGHY